MRILVTDPPAPFVSLDEAKAHLRVFHDDEDALITGLIAAACAHLDGPPGWLGRSIAGQDLEVRGELFTSCVIALPFPPVIAVASVKYLDTSGVEQTMAPELYEVRGDVIAPVFGKSWPAARWQAENVRVQYQAGYETLPPPIRAAALLMIGDLYSNRETTLSGAVVQQVPMSTTVGNLLSPFRVW